MYKTGCGIANISADNECCHGKYDFRLKGKDQFLNVLSSQFDGIIQKFKIHANTIKPFIFQPRRRELTVIYIISCQIRIST